MKKIIVLMCFLLLTGCQNAEPSQSVTQSEDVSSAHSEAQTSSTDAAEPEGEIVIIDGIPCWNKENKKPLLELAPATSEEQKQSEAVRRRLLGQGGKSYHIKVLFNSVFLLEELEKQTLEDAERLCFRIFSDYGEKVLEECSPEDRDALLGLGLDTETLIYLLNLSEVTPEFLLSLSEVQKENLRELYSSIMETNPKMEEMGMIHPRRTMTGTKECLLLVLSQPSDEEFRQQAEEKNIPHWMQDELLRRGNIRSEILAMTEEEREKALTPAINNYLYFSINNGLKEDLWLTKTGQSFLEKRCWLTRVSLEQISRLTFLGYTDYDIVMLSDEEWEFLFPLEELPDKLNQYGFSDEEIARYETRLKYIVREALQIKESLEE